MFQGFEQIEVIGSKSRKAVVRYHDKICATDIDVRELTRSLADFHEGLGANSTVDHFLRIVNTCEEVGGVADASLEGIEAAGSIVDYVTAHKTSALILWRGQMSEQLAISIGQRCRDGMVMPLPFPSSPMLEGMVERYRQASGFPSSPQWQSDESLDSVKPMDLNQSVLDRRVIVLIAENISYWEIDAVLAATVSEGTPVLPITFAAAKTLIGPLILGGNSGAFYLSRLGLNAYSSVETSSAVQLLTASQRYDGDVSDVVVNETLNIIERLPDNSCICLLEVERNGKVQCREVYPKRSIFDQRLKGTLWSIESVLNADVTSAVGTWQRAASHLQNGGLVSIDEAFNGKIAEIMHASLASSTRWRAYEAMYPYFFFHHHNIYDAEEMSPAMLVAGMIFASRSTVQWAAELAGSECDGEVQQSASWYMPGDHSTPHSDAASRRKLAFIWHLAEGWDATWGGHLVWVGGDKIIGARYNTLHLFDTRKSGRHFVMPVAPNARGRRLCWNGWWTASLKEPDDDVSAGPSDSCERVGAFRFY